ncbi:MAG: Slp family lipoprotein [Gammaproteobacteria bacterium]
MRNLLFLLLSLPFAIGGCTTDPLKSVEVSDVTISQAAATPDAFRGQLVRWGGTIIGISNLQDHSMVEVLGKPLASFSEPDDRKMSTGRFMVRIPGFVDPAEYQEPNRLTVVGSLAGVTQGKVRDCTYTYPLVQARQRKLWAGNNQVAQPLYYSPGWYDPFYYHRWPYWYAAYPRPPVKPPVKPPASKPPPPAR